MQEIPPPDEPMDEPNPDSAPLELLAPAGDPGPALLTISRPSRRPEDWLPLILLPLLALGIALPLILHGCSCGHDFDFHLLSWLEAARQLRHFTLYPHWLYSASWGAGEPRFVFYPPITWLLGELLALIYWPAASVAFVIIALSAIGLCFHRLARAFASPAAALIASALFMVNPYMLFTVYERTAYAELLAAAWFCLLLLALLRDRPTATSIAVPLALLWLTNVPAAIIGTYTLAIVLLVRFVHGWISIRKLPAALVTQTFSGAVLGLSLAGIYLVPAIWESRWIQTNLANPPGMLPRNNLLFGQFGDFGHIATLHTASVVAVLLLAFALLVFAGLWFVRRRPTFTRPAPRFLLPILLLLALGIAFLLNPPSASLWPILPEANFLQFPWRLLLVLGPVAALAFALLLSRFSLRILPAALIAALIGAALIPPSIRAFRQFCDPEDTPAGLRALWQDHTGFAPVGEYTPNGASDTAIQHGNPAYWLSPDPDNQPDTSDDDISPPLPSDFLVNSPQRQFLILNLREYPAWRVRMNGQLVPSALHRHRNDGLIAVPIIAGFSTVDISYATTPDVTLGRILSLLALIRLFILLDRRSRRRADLSSAQQ